MADCKICAKQDDCPFAISSDIICSSYKQRSMSNADRIWAMSDEEMAEYLIRDVEAEAICRAGRYLTNIEIDRAVVACLDWLRSPAEVKK